LRQRNTTPNSTGTPPAEYSKEDDDSEDDDKTDDSEDDDESKDSKDDDESNESDDTPQLYYTSNNQRKLMGRDQLNNIINEPEKE
jgi:hypothetical protein